MQSVTLIFLATVVTMALAVGQYYVPRSYYFIDSAGHESAPVPLRRLRRSVGPYYPNGRSGASANANANANAYGGDANANAEANANAYGDYGRGNGGGGGGGGYRPCYGPGCVGSGNPRSLGSRGN